LEKKIQQTLRKFVDKNCHQNMLDGQISDVKNLSADRGQLGETFLYLRSLTGGPSELTVPHIQTAHN